MADIAAITVNWNRSDHTIRCIKSLAECDNKIDLCSITIVDNASAESDYKKIKKSLRQLQYEPERMKIPIALRDSVSEISAYKLNGTQTGPAIILIRNRSNHGFAKANNIAIILNTKLFDPSFFFFINNDALVESGAIGALSRKMASEPDIGICGCTILSGCSGLVQAYGGSRFSPFTGRAWALGAGGAYREGRDDSWAERQIDFVEGAAMFICKALFERVGLFSEDYFLYNEEIDISWRARGEFRLGVAVSAIVFHQVGASIGTGAQDQHPSPLALFFKTRSRLKFALNHTPIWVPLVWLTLLAQFARYFLRPKTRALSFVILRVLMGRWVPKEHWFTAQACQV